MASIYKRKNKDGKTCGWRAVIRATGYPIVCKQFERKQEAEDWATSVEQQIRSGQFKFERHKVQRTFSELVDHFMQSGALEHHRSARDTTRHLEYWRERLGKYALVHLIPEHLGKERQFLIDTPTYRNTKSVSQNLNFGIHP